MRVTEHPILDTLDTSHKVTIYYNDSSRLRHWRASQSPQRSSMPEFGHFVPQRSAMSRAGFFVQSDAVPTV